MSNCIVAICKCGKMVFAGRKDAVKAAEIGRYVLDGYTVKTITDQSDFMALKYGCSCQKQNGASGN